MQTSSYNFQSPNEKSGFKQSHAQFQLMQSTAYGTQNNFRETVNSFQSSQNSQPLRYSSTQFQHSPERETHTMSKFQGSMTSLNKQSMVSPSHHVVASSGDVRDRIINTYRDEIKMNVARERDFQHLENQIAELQRRTQLLELNLDESQKDHEERLNGQNKTITHLQSDIENLKKNITDKQQEGIKVYDDIQKLKSEIASKDSDIYQTSKDNETTKAYNDQLRREIDFLQQDIFNQQDLKKRQQGAIYNLKGDIRAQEKENQDQSTRLTVLDKEHHSLMDRMHYLNKQIDNKDAQLEKTQSNLIHTQRDLAVLQSSINGLDLEIVEVERANDRALEQQKKLLRQKDQEGHRGADLTYANKEAEKRLREDDIQYEQLKKEAENFKYSNDVLLDRNHELKVELDSLNSHSELLQEQNRELQRELDQFVETDEVVRRNLDRKDKVYQIRSKVDDVIKKSMVDLQSRSPQRMRSPVQPMYNGPHEEEMRQSQLRASHFYESMNNRGSPLRRVNLDH